MQNVIQNNGEGLNWPVPGFFSVTSFFGKRNKPTHGASSVHSGIDISVPEGTAILAMTNGKIIYQGFNGANGYTIIISNDKYIFQYSHVSEYFKFSVGEYVKSGDIVAYVGPKYIDRKENNIYQDSTGRFTNGATTGVHLHFSVKENGEYVNPLTLFGM